MDVPSQSRGKRLRWAGVAVSSSTARKKRAKHTHLTLTSTASCAGPKVRNGTQSAPSQLSGALMERIRSQWLCAHRFCERAISRTNSKTVVQQVEHVHKKLHSRRRPKAAKRSITAVMAEVVVRAPDSLTTAHEVVTEASSAAARRQEEIRRGSIAGTDVGAVLPQVSKWLSSNPDGKQGASKGAPPAHTHAHTKDHTAAHTTHTPQQNGTAHAHVATQLPNQSTSLFKSKPQRRRPAKAAPPTPSQPTKPTPTPTPTSGQVADASVEIQRAAEMVDKLKMQHAKQAFSAGTNNITPQHHTTAHTTPQSTKAQAEASAFQSEAVTMLSTQKQGPTDTHTPLQAAKSASKQSTSQGSRSQSRTTPHAKEGGKGKAGGSVDQEPRPVISPQQLAAAGEGVAASDAPSTPLPVPRVIEEATHANEADAKAHSCGPAQEAKASGQVLHSLGLAGAAEVIGSWQLPDASPEEAALTQPKGSTRTQQVMQTKREKADRQAQQELQQLIRHSTNPGSKTWKGPRPGQHLAAWCQHHKLPPPLLEARKVGRLQHHGLCILQHLGVQVVTGHTVRSEVRAQETAALYTLLMLEGALSPGSACMKIQQAGDSLLRHAAFQGNDDPSSVELWQLQTQRPLDLATRILPDEASLSLYEHSMLLCCSDLNAPHTEELLTTLPEAGFAQKDASFAEELNVLSGQLSDVPDWLPPWPEKLSPPALENGRGDAEMVEVTLTPAKRAAPGAQLEEGAGAQQQDDTAMDIGAPPLKKRTRVYGSTYQVTYHEWLCLTVDMHGWTRPIYTACKLEGNQGALNIKLENGSLKIDENVALALDRRHRKEVAAARALTLIAQAGFALWAEPA